MEANAGPRKVADNYPSQQILGVRFFDGPATDAANYIRERGGYVVVPAAPALVKLRYDPEFRAAIVDSDLAIADSGLMVLLWRLLWGRKIQRLSGLTYLKRVIELPEVRRPGGTFWVIPSALAKEKAFEWSKAKGFAVIESDFYVAPRYSASVKDETLLTFIEHREARHIIIGIGGGPQEKLGRYLRDHLSYRPAIHCIGAALGFLTGDQIGIPDWADRFYLGWLLRLFAQPRIFIPRLSRALQLPWLILRYGEQLPPGHASDTEI